MPSHHTGFRDPGPQPVQGRFVLDVFRAGRLVEHVDERNMIVVNAGAILAALLGGGIASPGLAQLGVGSSMIPSAYGNTVLTNPYLRPLNAADYPVPGSVRFAFQLDAGEANGLSIGEFGLFSAAGVLFARKTRTFDPIPKDALTALRGTWTIEF